MIKHSFKIIWNQKKKNSYIISELFVLFLVLLMSSVYLIDKYELYTGGVGASIDDIFYFRLNKKDFKNGDFSKQLTNLESELESLSPIKEVSFSMNSIPYIWSMDMHSMEYDSNYVNVVTRYVDEDFAGVFEISMVEGSWFEDDYSTPQKPIVVDIQVAKKLFGNKENAINKTVQFNGDRIVVGVFDKFKRNDYEKNYPACFIPFPLNDVNIIDVVIKYKSGELPNPTRISKIVFSNFDKEEFDIRYASTMMAKKRDVNSNTQVEIVMVSFLAVFLVINIILGMIGIFGYSVKRRKAEIGLRKAVGSSEQQVRLLLLLESWILTILALIPAIFITIQIPLLDLFPVEFDLFLKALLLSVILIFSLVSLSVYYPGLIASKAKAVQALQDE